MQGWLDVKEQEMEAQSKMMGGGKSSPTSGSVKNARGPSGAHSGTDTRVESKSFVNPNAGDPTEDS